MTEKNEVITYDYKTVIVKREMETMTTDAYENLGWEFVGSSLAGAGGIFSVSLSFKRDRKIANKQNLLKLQEKVDGALQNIEVLQKKKKSAGVIPALCAGVLGALIFGGGMSMVLVLGIEAVKYMVGGIILGAAGLGISLLGWPFYKKFNKKGLAAAGPMLEDEYNKLADFCEEAR